jgi:hypothetical protein
MQRFPLKNALKLCYICFSVIVPFFDQIKQKFPLKNALKLCYICFSVIVPFFDQIKQKFPLKKCTKTMLHFFFNSTLLWPNKVAIPLKNALKLRYISFFVIVPFFDQIKQQFPLKNTLKLCYIWFFCNSILLWPNKTTIPLRKIH